MMTNVSLCCAMCKRWTQSSEQHEIEESSSGPWAITVSRVKEKKVNMCELRQWDNLILSSVVSRTNLIIFLLFLEKSRKCFVSRSTLFRSSSLPLSFLDFSSRFCWPSRKNHSQRLLRTLSTFFREFFFFFWASNSVKPLRVRRETWVCEFFCAAPCKFHERVRVKKIGVGIRIVHWFARKMSLRTHALYS